ncbi:MAG: 23S rRNA (uracil(1939)-C(5))-methyltransferase RlmD [Clostridia bacterium]|nr:23S rRNA (uracil(1939)-C(5))-methyltransferase RlmD [Clostridia bacterium]
MEPFDLTITGIGSELQGVGRADDGRVVFVPYALPGERITVKPVNLQARYIEGEALRVLSPIPERCQPLCPQYGACGGCRAQHMTAEYALHLKRQVVIQQIERIGRIKDPNVLPVIAADSNVHYRNKAEFSIIWDDKRRGPVLGMFSSNDESVIPVTDCLLQKPEISEVTRIVLEWMRKEHIQASDREGKRQGLRFLVTRENEAGDIMVVLSGIGQTIGKSSTLVSALREIRQAHYIGLYYCQLKPRFSHALDGVLKLVDGKDALQETLCGLRFSVSPQTFLQVNHDQTEVLYNLVDSALKSMKPNLVFDAFCGCGTMSLMFAKWCQKVVGVEINKAAIEDAKRNAQINGLSDHTTFIAADAGHIVTDMLNKGTKPEALVVDPPRKGVDQRLLDAIIRARIPCLVYVSCNPGTLARDLRILFEGGYHLEWAQPVDMFPLTEHVESVVKLTRAGL